ncbi:hypothetical protein LTR94_030104, partial [Friedmanniomyces endolithicus]
MEYAGSPGEVTFCLGKVHRGGAEGVARRLLAELAQLVTQMESGALPLEASVAAYARGSELVKYCAAQLEKVESQVKVLEGDMLKPFSDDEDFSAWTREVQARVEEALDAFLPPADRVPHKLHEAMRYTTLGGGKRVRPLLAYAAGALFDADPAALARVASA